MPRIELRPLMEWTTQSNRDIPGLRRRNNRR